MPFNPYFIHGDKNPLYQSNEFQAWLKVDTVKLSV